MTPERWQQINEALDAVLERPVGERAAYLDAHHPDDPELREKVAELAAAYEEAHSFLEAPIAGYAAPLVAEPEAASIAGKRVGPYRLLRRIARGGMGTVYLAARDDDQYQKKVAVKLIRRGMDTEDVLRRFLAERQILARLEHPYIARLIDGGATDDDRPYFVMEYVEGQPLDAYCNEHRLSIARRLGLFLHVCEAVRYAHQNLVIHRDLKPSNILVSEDATVKLLDFGIAKLLTDDDATAALTKTGMRLMTPEYAAPEQVRGEAVTTATDVYALGVLLYKLLTGRLPYRVRGMSQHEIERVILDTDPTRPSTAITIVRAEDSEGAPTPEAISRDRGTSVSALRRRLSGDLDNIVLKALKKEPEHRYASVEAFEEDVRRYLAGLPVRARKDTLWYRASKFTRRHWFGVAASVVILVLIVSYALTTRAQAEQVASERDKAEQVAAFLADLFKRADPFETADSMTVRQVLERGAARVEEELADQPAVQAQMMVVISEVYQNLGLYNDGLALAEKSLTLRRATFGEMHPDVAASLFRVADIICYLGDYETSDSLYRVSLAMRRTLLGEEHLDVAESLDGLGLMLYYKEGGRDESEAVLREALAMRRKLLGEDDPRVAQSMHNLAATRYGSGKKEDVEPLLRQALAIRRTARGNDHPDLASNMSFLAHVLLDSGRADEAEALLREALDINRLQLGPDHPMTARAMLGLARLLHEQNRYAEAEALLREALPIERRRLGEDHEEVQTIRNALEELAHARSASGEAH